MFEKASNPEFEAFVERLRTFVDKEVLIEISSTPDPEDDVLALNGVICRTVDVHTQEGRVCLRSAGGHDLGQLSLDPERIGSIEVDTISVGFEFASFFVMVWDHKALLERQGRPLDCLVEAEDQDLSGGDGLLEAVPDPDDENAVDYAAVVETLFGFVGTTVRAEVGHEAFGGAEVSTFPDAMVCAVETIQEDQGRLAGKGVRLYLGRNGMRWADLAIYEQMVKHAESDDGCLYLELNGPVVRISGPKPSITTGPDF